MKWWTLIGGAVTLTIVAAMAEEQLGPRGWLTDGPPAATRADTPRDPARDTLFADWRFEVGERHEFRIRVGPLRFGRAVFSVEGKEEVRGEATHRLVLHVEGKAPFFSVDNEETSWVKTHPALETLRFRQVLEEGGDRADRIYEIFPETRSYHRLEWDEEREEHVLVEQREGVVPPDALDEPAQIYLLRLLKTVEPGLTYRMERHFLPEGNPTTLRVVGRDRVRVPAGTFDVWVLQPSIPESELFRPEQDARLYMTTDSTRKIVQIETRVRGMPFTLYLDEYEPGG